MYRIVTLELLFEMNDQTKTLYPNIHFGEMKSKETSQPLIPGGLNGRVPLTNECYQELYPSIASRGIDCGIILTRRSPEDRERYNEIADHVIKHNQLPSRELLPPRRETHPHLYTESGLYIGCFPTREPLTLKDVPEVRDN